jgi:hypothetical protein
MPDPDCIPLYLWNQNPSFPHDIPLHSIPFAGFQLPQIEFRSDRHAMHVKPFAVSGDGSVRFGAYVRVFVLIMVFRKEYVVRVWQ